MPHLHYDARMPYGFETIVKPNSYFGFVIFQIYYKNPK